jgi:hypothetical protein
MSGSVDFMEGNPEKECGILNMPPSSESKMKAICSSKMSVSFEWTTRHYIPENTILHNHIS